MLRKFTPPFLALLLLCICTNHVSAQLNINTAEAKKLYNIPFYSYPGKNGFEKENVHIKDETVIMLCYQKQAVQMVVYWKSGLSFKEAEEWMKPYGTDWQEQAAPGFDKEVIKQHEEDFNFRLDPYMKQLRSWKNSRGDLAFFDSFHHELIIQSASLGTKKVDLPDADFYMRLGQLDLKPIETSTTSLSITGSTSNPPPQSPEPQTSQPPPSETKKE